jgi:hypothetical protein
MLALLLHYSLLDVVKRGIVELEIEREFYLMNVRGAELILSAPLYKDFILHPEKLIKICSILNQFYIPKSSETPYEAMTHTSSELVSFALFRSPNVLFPHTVTTAHLLHHRDLDSIS